MLLRKIRKICPYDSIEQYKLNQIKASAMSCGKCGILWRKYDIMRQIDSVDYSIFCIKWSIDKDESFHLFEN